MDWKCYKLSNFAITTFKFLNNVTELDLYRKRNNEKHFQALVDFDFDINYLTYFFSYSVGNFNNDINTTNARFKNETNNALKIHTQLH